MDLSVVIATFNRAPILEETLESYFAMELPRGVTSELVIVDNGSTDETAQVVEAQRARAPECVSLVTEPQAGLSHARNAGLRRARGALIAFTDDDVELDRRWAAEVVAAFGEYPEAMCLGGRSVPRFESGEPEWLESHARGIYGSTNSGDVARWMVFPEHPFGLNMAFRRAVFDQIGPFEVSLGRQHHSLLSNEESELFYRVARAGLPVLYTPRALVHHRIPSARTKKRWVLRRSYWQGISDVVLRQLTQPASRLALLRGAQADARRAATSVLRSALTLAARRRQATSFSALLECTYRIGAVKQRLRELATPTKGAHAPGKHSR